MYLGECCGMILGPKYSVELKTVRRCKNVYDEYHAEDPDLYPRTSRTAYMMDPREILAIEKACRTSGDMVKVIYHSHVDVGAYFSEEDKRVAMSNGEPVFPGVAYLVISCAEGRSEKAELFLWDEIKLDFVCVEEF